MNSTKRELRAKLEEIVYEDEEVGEKTIVKLLHLFIEEMEGVIGEDQKLTNTDRKQAEDIEKVNEGYINREELLDGMQKLLDTENGLRGKQRQRLHELVKEI